MSRLVALLLASACLAGCGGGTTSTTAPPAAATPPASPTSVDFTAFTKELLSNQSDSAEPVPVTATQFLFPDNDNPTAFADVLPVI
ncbi:MAG TPA: hypothetical protein VGD47_08350 [Steroidobacteraceae bacterium]